MVTLSGSSASVRRLTARQLSSVSPSMPAMRSMLICGNPMRARVRERARDFRRAVRAAVQFQDAIVEVLDAEAQPRHAEAPDLIELGLVDGARLALERDLLGGGPRRVRGEPSDQ